MPDIYWFQLLKFDNLMLLFLIYDSELNMFGFGLLVELNNTSERIFSGSGK